MLNLSSSWPRGLLAFLIAAGLTGCRPASPAKPTSESTADSTTASTQRDVTSDLEKQAAADAIAAIAAGTAPNIPPSPGLGQPPMPGGSRAPGSVSGSVSSTASGSAPNAGSGIDAVPEGKQYRLATLAIDRGDLATAEKIQNELSNHPQYKCLADALTGLMLVKQGKHDEAIKIAEEISAIPVMQAEAYVIAGEVFQRQNRLTEALGAFESAVGIDPNHFRAHRWLGAIYYDTGAMRFAETHLRTAGKLNPSDVNSLLLSSRIFKDYEQYEEAVIDLRELLKRDLQPQVLLHVQLKLAECLIMLRQLEEARQLLNACPQVVGVLAARAAIAEAEGDFEGALRQALDVLQHAPDNRLAGLIAARILVAEKKWDTAIEVLQKMVQRSPYEHEPRLLYGRALVRSGQTELGESEIKQATELKDTFLKFADLHQDAMRRPGDVELRIELGRLAEKLGKPELARVWYFAAIGLDPTNKGAVDALGKLPPQASSTPATGISQPSP